MIKMSFFDKIYNAVIANANEQVSLRRDTKVFLACILQIWTFQCFIVSGTPEDSHIGWLLPSNK